MVQLGKGLPYFNALFADNMNLITGHANEIVLSKLLMLLLSVKTMKYAIGLFYILFMDL